MNIPTRPLNRATYLAPLIPIDILSITGKGKPCFCDGLPIKFEKKQTKNPEIKQPAKTIKIFKSYTKYKDAINENPITL